MEDKIKDLWVDRIALLNQVADDPKAQAIELEICKRDPVYFFNNYLYTTNPRIKGRDIPFCLYDYQEWLVPEIVKCIEEGEDLGIEKSRDMGLTWLLMGVFLWMWLFREGSVLHCGSIKEPKVDVGLIDPDITMFGKFRYMLYGLPTWMRPSGMDTNTPNDKKLSILNPDNNNVITGESPNINFGRSQRYTAILFDELAFWENAEPAYEGCADTTNCRLVVSTPHGESNKYYKIMHDPTNEVIEFPEAKHRYEEKLGRRV